MQNNNLNYKIKQLPKSMQKYIKTLEESTISEECVEKIKEYLTAFVLKYYLSLKRRAYKDFKSRMDDHFKNIDKKTESLGFVLSNDELIDKMNFMFSYGDAISLGILIED